MYESKEIREKLLRGHFGPISTTIKVVYTGNHYCIDKKDAYMTKEGQYMCSNLFLLRS